MFNRKLLLFCVCFCVIACGQAVETTIVKLSPENTTAVLNCNGTSVTWKKDGVDVADQTGPALDISKSGAGKYTCYSSTGDEIVKYEVLIIGKTIVEQSHKSLTFNNGDEDRSISCENIDSSPTVTFTWYFRPEESEVYAELTSNKDYTIESNSVNSTLNFQNLTYTSRGYYMCEGTNSAGKSSSEILIRVKDRLAALWPFLGIVLEVVILIAVIFIYEKRSQKASEESNADTKDEAVPLKGDESDDIRLRTRNNNSK